MKNNKKYLLAALLIAVVGVVVWNYFYSKKEDVDSLPKITFRQGWFTYAGFAGEVYATENSIDSLNGIQLTVEQGADDIDAVKLVLAGKNDFGITSAEAVFAANEIGADLVIVGVVNHLSPTCFISLATNNIEHPQDFENKKIGVLAGSETETVYRELVRRLNLNKDKIKEIDAPYDLTTFIRGEYDVYPGFYYSETVALDFQNIQYKVMHPSEYGVSLMGAVYFTTKKYLEENPDKVKAFVNSLAMGWEAAIANPDKAIRKLYQYDSSIDTVRELASLKKGLDYFRGEDNRVLFVSQKTIQEQLNALYHLGKIKDTTNYSGVYLNYVESYHANNK